ncbi:MAG TPA: hypothetical protein VGO60_15320 [Iamia sp.]|nr:hypothetical protein [Iamia sp.]
MTRLALLRARASLRGGPGRAVAVVLLLAAWLPALVDTSPAVSGLVTAAVAIAAALGAVNADPGRHQVLDRNGASTWDRTVLGAADLAGPAAVAFVLATLLSLPVWPDGPHPVEALIVAGLVPIVAGALTGWVLSPRRAPRWWVTALIVVLAAVLAPMIVPSAVLIVRLGRGHPILRLVATVACVAGAVTTALIVGQAESWFDLQWVLFLAAGPLTVAVAWISAQLMGLAAGPLRRLGPIARLAATPLVVRRAHLGPIAAAVGLVVTLAAMEGVVGASFGAREAGRDRRDVVLGTAGTTADQSIVVTSNLDADETRTAVAEAATGRDVRVAVIDQLGEGGTETQPDVRANAPPPSGVPRALPEADGGALGDGLRALRPGVSVAADEGPTWVGVATAADLTALGHPDLTPALDRGLAVILNRGVAEAPTIELVGSDGARIARLPAVRAPDHAPAVLFPAVVVSPAVAADLGVVRHGARVVVVPTDPEGDESRSDAVEVTDEVDGQAREAPVETEGTGVEVVAAFTRYFESQTGPTGGDEELVREPGGPYNAVPFLSGTAGEGSSRGWALGVAALLVGVAGTVLVLGGSRAEDAVLEAQGAAPRTRVVVAAVQAGAVALTGSVLGGLAGIGLPALAMTAYNDGVRVDGLPDIPVVVPASVPILLVVLPVAAAVIAAAVVRLRPIAPAVDLALLDA